MPKREQAQPWEEAVGRVGYGARAAMYALVASFALAAAVRVDPREAKGVGEALRALVHEPGGRFLIGALALGLLAHTVWRALQAIADIEHVGHGWRGLVRRFGYACVGLFYAALFVEALLLLVHHPHADGEERSWMARVLMHPFGRLVVFGVGVGLLVYGVVEEVQAVRARFVRDFDGGKLHSRTRRMLAWIGRVGIALRGLLFATAGVLLVGSAWRARADTIGTGDVLRRLGASAFGIPVIAVFALGLFAYAGLMLAEAAWRHMNPRDR